MMLDSLSSQQALENQFTYHLSALNSDSKSEVCRSLWQAIASHYSESVRAYHNLTHLQQLFEQFEYIKSNLKQPSILALALFYHDIIYDPTQPDNELKSAEYAIQHLQEYLTSEQCAHIYALIMMTATHQLDNKNDNPLDSDAAFLLDMDISILGADWASYERYAQAVRQEYSHVAIDDYRHGRIKILAGLLAHDSLYLTDYYKRLEQQARENIAREITSLKVL